MMVTWFRLGREPFRKSGTGNTTTAAKTPITPTAAAVAMPYKSRMPAVRNICDSLLDRSFIPHEIAIQLRITLGETRFWRF